MHVVRYTLSERVEASKQIMARKNAATTDQSCEAIRGKFTIQVSYALITLDSSPQHSSLTVQVSLNGKPLLMQTDTGASATVISRTSLWEILPPLEKCKSKLRTYTDEGILILWTLKTQGILLGVVS